jgi:hypothetical protein
MHGPRRAAIALLAGLALGIPAAAQGALRSLSADETSRLGRGEAIVRSVPDYRRLALAAPGKAADGLRSAIAALKPNYLSEVIASAQAADDAAAAAILDRLAAALAEPKGYVGIPYYSKRQKKTYDLFDKMEILARKAAPGGESIEVLQHMEPFDDFRARYEYSLEGGTLRFSGTNLDGIIYSYRKFKAVSAGGMLWSLYAFREGDRLIFYGVGAVNAFDLFGVFRDRLETSFTGRIEAFFTAMSSKMRDK